MSKLSRRSVIARVALVSLFLAFCLGASLWANKVYRQPLNPVSVIVDEAQPESLPEEDYVELIITPQPSSTSTRLPVSDSEPVMQPETSPSPEMDTAVLATAVPTLTPQSDPSSTPTITPTAEPERINILLMGSDSRVGALVSRTDTMMLLSVNLQEQTVSLLSIPRDLYVEIPGYGRDRLNTAFVHGADTDNGNPVAGAATVIETIEQTLGVSIDHYVLVNLRAVERTIDDMGGVDMYVPYTISDPTYINRETGEPLLITEGLNHFDGDTALRYVRTRHQDSDFARSNRQQQLLLALRQKALNLGVAEMLARVPLLYQHIKSGVFTDLSLEDMVAMAQIGSDIPAENINTAVLNSDYVTSYRTEEGSHVLLLIPEKVAPLIRQMFYDEAPPEQTPQPEE